MPGTHGLMRMTFRLRELVFNILVIAIQVDRVVVGVSSTAEFQMLLSDAAVVAVPTDLPNLACTDPDLINPSNWNQP